jgi:hypothetical protein
MKHSENKEQYILLDNLFNLFLYTKIEEDDEESLKDEKVEINKIVQKNLMLFRQLKTQARAELNQAKHTRVKEFLSDMKAGLAANVDVYKRIADEIFSKPKFAAYKTMFRNLSEVSEQDKKAIMMDSKLLDLLSEIEEEYNKKVKK